MCSAGASLPAIRRSHRAELVNTSKNFIAEISLTSSSRPLSFLSNYHFLEGLPGCDFPADGCFRDFKERGSSPYTLPSEPFWYSYRTLTFWNKNGAAARSSGMGIGGRSLPLNRRKGSGKYFWKNFFSVPRPAGVNFFIINIVPERTPKKIFRGFIARQNAVFVLCIRMV